MNVRHVSHFSEFFLSYTQSTDAWKLDKNLHSISLNKSKNYKIENLSLDIGSSQLNSIYSSLKSLSFPLRFFFDNDPLNNEWNRLKISPSYDIRYNNTLILLPNSLPAPNAIDILDSSNNDLSSGVYNNLFQVDVSGISADLPIQLRKTNTISEYNFFNLSQTQIISGSTSIFNTTVSNNDVNNFYFNSNHYEYLNFSIYPGCRFTSVPAGSEFLIRFNFTINFDLVEY
jgi:hypothetical protein